MTSGLSSDAGADSEAARDFAGTVAPLLPAALRLARAQGCSADEAADAVQEALIASWRHRAQLRGPFRPWFLAIVSRRARRTRRWLTVGRFWSTGATDWPDNEAMDPGLVVALRALPARQRAALWLRYGLDLSTAELARVLDTTEPAAKQLLLRARIGMRRQLPREARR